MTPTQLAQAALEWFGQAGHFVASDRCRFHLHTHVNGLCVSTVGEYYPPGWGQPEPDNIGAGRLYETMVFRLLASGEPDYGDPIDQVPYNDRDAANAGHMAMLAKYAAIDHLTTTEQEQT